jgi:hypothetical protein
LRFDLEYREVDFPRLSNDAGVHGAPSGAESSKVRRCARKGRWQDYLDSLGAFEDVSIGQDISLRVDDDAGTKAA